MAWTEKYVSALSDGGDGSIGDPYTWAEGLAALAAGTRLNVKADGTYSLSTNQAISTTGPWIIQGYASTIGDGGRPVLDWSTNTVDGMTITGSGSILIDLDFLSSASSGSYDGLRVGASNNLLWGIVARGWRENGIEHYASGLGCLIVYCEAYNCNNAGTVSKAGFATASGTVYVRCVSHDHNSGDADAHGFLSVSTTVLRCINCIADTCGGHGFFINSRSYVSCLINCDSYNNGGSGFNLDLSSYIPSAFLQNCNSISNGAYGYRTVQAESLMILSNCFDYNNTSGRLSDAGKVLDLSPSSQYTAVPYTDGPNGNYILHSTNGAAGRNAAIASFLQSQGYSGSTVSYFDVGAGRHQDPAGGGAGGGLPIVGGSLVR